MCWGWEPILNQIFKDFELIIIDDGSTDNSTIIIENYAKKDKKIKIIKKSFNVGLTKCLNKAISVSQGEFIACQDADDISLPNRLRKQLNFLEQNLDYAFCGGIEIIRQNRQDLIKFFEENEIKKNLIVNNCFPHSSILIRKEILKKYGYYNEKFRYGQDYELWCRLIYKYQLKGKNLHEKLIIRGVRSSKISRKKINKFLFQYINELRTKIYFLRYTQYKFKGIISIIFKVFQIITLMPYFVLSYIIKTEYNLNVKIQ